MTQYTPQLMEETLRHEYAEVVEKYHHGNVMRADTFATRVIMDKLARVLAAQGEDWVMVSAPIMVTPFTTIEPQRSTMGDIEVAIGISYHGKKFSDWKGHQWDFTDLKPLRFKRKGK